MNMKKCQIMRNWETLYKAGVNIAYKTNFFREMQHTLFCCCCFFYILLKYIFAQENLFSEFAKRPQHYNLISCSTEWSMKFIMFINVKMATAVGILTFRYFLV